eukprot:Nitzschia sp. Nitz4//scaffold120_size68122//34348//36693//NITZ4_006046-RA/size68122-augustus-gene-0.57-mRNA-1//1//CDS//3329534284//9308//frame0
MEPDFNSSNSHDILGCAKTATSEQIEQAYEELSLRHHPSYNNDDDEALNAFVRIGEAYTMLSALCHDEENAMIRGVWTVEEAVAAFEKKFGKLRTFHYSEGGILGMPTSHFLNKRISNDQSVCTKLECALGGSLRLGFFRIWRLKGKLDLLLAVVEVILTAGTVAACVLAYFLDSEDAEWYIGVVGGVALLLSFSLLHFWYVSALFSAIGYYAAWCLGDNLIKTCLVGSLLVNQALYASLLGRVGVWGFLQLLLLQGSFLITWADNDEENSDKAFKTEDDTVIEGGRPTLGEDTSSSGCGTPQRGKWTGRTGHGGAFAFMVQQTFEDGEDSLQSVATLDQRQSELDLEVYPTFHGCENDSIMDASKVEPIRIVPSSDSYLTQARNDALVTSNNGGSRTINFAGEIYSPPVEDPTNPLDMDDDEGEPSSLLQMYKMIQKKFETGIFPSAPAVTTKESTTLELGRSGTLCTGASDVNEVQETQVERLTILGVVGTAATGQTRSVGPDKSQSSKSKPKPSKSLFTTSKPLFGKQAEKSTREVPPNVPLPMAILGPIGSVDEEELTIVGNFGESMTSVVDPIPQTRSELRNGIVVQRGRRPAPSTLDLPSEVLPLSSTASESGAMQGPPVLVHEILHRQHSL